MRLCSPLILLPTFLEAAGQDARDHDHVLEGQSLLGALRGDDDYKPRDYAFCEYDYSMRPMANTLGLNTQDARIFMVADKKWKLIHFEGGFRPMLFDLENDPQELCDLGTDPAYQREIERLQTVLNGWARRPAQRTTVTNAKLRSMRDTTTNPNLQKGVVIGAVSAADIPPQQAAFYKGHKAVNKQNMGDDGGVKT